MHLLPQRRAALRAGQLEADAAIRVVAWIATVYGGGVDPFSHARATGWSSDRMAGVNHPPELAGPPTPEELETTRNLRDALVAQGALEAQDNTWIHHAVLSIPAGPLDARDRRFLLRVIGHCPPVSRWDASLAVHVLVALSSPSEAAEVVEVVRALGDRLYASGDCLDDDLFAVRTELEVLADMGA